MPAPSFTSPQCRNRAIGAAIGLAALAPLLVAVGLTPDTSGIGTHQQLGLGECGFHAVTGMPCATCGMTTAFAYAAHGDLRHAMAVQPAGLLLCVGCAAMAIIGVWSAWSGMSLAPLGRVMGKLTVMLAALGVLLVSWGYTIWMHRGG